MHIVNRIFGLYLSLFCCMMMTLVGCTSDSDLEPSDYEDGEIDTATEWMDEVLSEQYLYNVEYNTLNRDLTTSYDSFLDKTLLSMNTNVLDKKYYASYDQYFIYSYVYREPVSKAITRATTVMESYGFLSVKYVNISNSNIVLAINAVNNNSPASAAGLTRGMVIEQINGINVENLSDPSSTIYYPSTGSTITVSYREYASEQSPLMSCTLTSCSVEQDPILVTDVFQNVSGSKKVGYLNYTSFDSNYDSTMLETIATLKSKGITDFILDLRLNLGGDVATSNKLAASMIPYSYTSGETFCQFRYNSTFSAKNSSYPNSMGASSYDSSTDRYLVSYNNSVSSRLDLTTIYCLVSSDTASASELLIVSLEDIDGITVNTIGSTTRGKNAAMLVSEQTIGDYLYTFLPITSECYGGAGTGGYQDGLTPDCEIDQYIGFSDFGVNEPLIATALSWIDTGVMPTQDVDAVANTLITRATDNSSLPKLNRQELPGVIVRPLAY